MEPETRTETRPEIRDATRPAATPGEVVLSVQHLKAGYGRIIGASDISLDVRRGELVAMFGSNGAGKSTVLRAVSGMIKPIAGTVTFNGTDVTGRRSDVLARAGLHHVPEGRRPLPRLTVEENLRLGGFALGGAELHAALDTVYDRFPRLRDRREQKAGTLSGGEQQMLVIGRAIVTTPQILLLDEPSLGLSPLLVREVFELIRGLAADGLTVLLVEQNVVQGLRVADRGYVLTTGTVTATGTADELQADPALLRSYLGGPERSAG
ncbi:ABC transporter ATP-binding protein [Nakamurella leprariae]|uniref:ABC transporter ATP-binding protein n=1 Tax=Nakamurella leprariae TaxID=2803911 RepID=A0A939C349_9ACTN|nr:ABC transporter ATP-binding protein [Nakamurella leprariae]MBM9468747.1 ABC transporter ATP-binding protein [Nakamurella leprariae]